MKRNQSFGLLPLNQHRCAILLFNSFGIVFYINCMILHCVKNKATIMCLLHANYLLLKLTAKDKIQVWKNPPCVQPLKLLKSRINKLVLVRGCKPTERSPVKDQHYSLCDLRSKFLLVNVYIDPL